MTAQADVGRQARQHAHWHWSEVAFWILALSCAFLFPSRYLIMTDIVRLALFALSLEPILGLFAFDMFGKVGFFYCLAVLFLLFLLARRIVHSPFGLSLRAIRNNPLRATAIGIPVNRRLIAIYTLAAFYAGIAGALFTQTTALASLDVFSFERSADLMLVLVIGGTGYLYGGLIGAVVFRMLQEVFQAINPPYRQYL